VPWTCTLLSWLIIHIRKDSNVNFTVEAKWYSM
jgi:hypothetical protein